MLLTPLFQIPSKDDPKELPDPFNDLSVGGWEITEEPVGRLSVWAVSLQGKVSPATTVPRVCPGKGGQVQARVVQEFPKVEEESYLPPVPGTGTSWAGRKVTRLHDTLEALGPVPHPSPLQTQM